MKMLRNINFILLCFFCISGITPIIGANMPVYILPIVYVLWFVTANLWGKFVPSKIYAVAIIGLSICWLYKIIGYSSAEIGNYFYVTIFYTMPICMLFVQRNFPIKYKQILSLLIIVTYLLNIVSNIFFFDNISSYTDWSYVASARDSDLVKTFNVGDTAFAVGSMILAGALTILTLLTKGWRKSFYLFGLVLTIYYNIQCAGRASVVLLLMIMIVCLILVYLHQGFNIKRALAFLLPTFLILLVLGGPFFHFLGDVIENERLSVRMHALGVLFEGGNTSNEETLGRGSLSLLSINTWLRDPITFLIGIGDHRYEAGSVEQVFRIGIGGHSSFFDTLARYGLIGFSLWISLFIYVFKYMRRITSNRTIGDMLYVACVMAFARSFIGGVFHVQFSVMTFILLPCSISLLIKSNKK